MNPWAVYPRVITSMDFLKRSEHLRAFRASIQREAYSSALRDWEIKAAKVLKRRKLLEESENPNPSRQEWLDNVGEKYMFDSDAIPDTLAAAIGGALEEADTEDDIAQVFADIWLGYP